jgi:hypothetical protein
MSDENNSSESRRVYRAGDTHDEDPRVRRDLARAARQNESARRTGSGRRIVPASAPGRRMKRSPIMAVVVLIAIAVIITLAGVASRDGGLQGSQNETGTFKLLPITTTTTS